MCTVELSLEIMTFSRIFCTSNHLIVLDKKIYNNTTFFYVFFIIIFKTNENVLRVQRKTGNSEKLYFHLLTSWVQYIDV